MGDSNASMMLEARSVSQRKQMIVVTGQYESRLFQPMERQWTNVRFEPDVNRLIAFAEDCVDPPQAILLVQEYPHQIRSESVRLLGEAYPLSTLIAVLGTWCEGEPRTGTPWPGVQRIYWHRMRHELTHSVDSGGESLNDGSSMAGLGRLVQRLQGCSTWSSSDESLIRSGLPIADGASLSGQCVSIRTVERESYQALADSCRLLGIEAHWLRWSSDRDERANDDCCLLWHGDLSSAAGQDDLRGFCIAEPTRPVIALLHFPRVHDETRAIELGACDICAMPLQLSELGSVIQRRHRVPAGTKRIAD